MAAYDAFSDFATALSAFTFGLAYLGACACERAAHPFEGVGGDILFQIVPTGRSVPMLFIIGHPVFGE